MFILPFGRLFREKRTCPASSPVEDGVEHELPPVEGSEPANRVCFAKSLTGYAHFHKLKECQDNSASFYDPETNTCLLAVADGHGSSIHFRSDRGSELAVEIAINTLKDFTGRIDPTLLFEKQEETVQGLCKTIADEWAEKVLEDVALNPFTDEEYQRAYCLEGRYIIEEGEKLLRPYGTTLIAAAVTAAYTLIIQIGDGFAVAVDKNGNYSLPVPKDERCFENFSTSLCALEAHKDFRYFVSAEDLAAVMLCTDGVLIPGLPASSSASAALHIIGKLCEFGECNEDFLRYLFDFLEDHGRCGFLKTLNIMGGSCDDISIAGMVDIKSCAKRAEKLEKIYRLNAEKCIASYQSEAADERVRSMKRKINILVDGYFKSQQAVKEAMNKAALAKKKEQEALEELDAYGVKWFHYLETMQSELEKVHQLEAELEKLQAIEQEDGGGDNHGF